MRVKYWYGAYDLSDYASHSELETSDYYLTINSKSNLFVIIVVQCTQFVCSPRHNLNRLSESSEVNPYNK